MKQLVLFCLLLLYSFSYAQNLEEQVMTLEEYLSYVKRFHPIVKQANLVINESEAKLLKARGAFDPKIEVDFNRKKFKDSEYFDKLNANFKIPTWYGIELKANFEENEGLFLNPEASLPNDGLYSAGVSVSLAKGFLTNDRMATLKQAKYFIKQAEAERQLLVNTILFNASNTYFNWLKYYNEKLLYDSFLENAEIRFNGIKRGFETGERAAIDTLEAKITLNTRKLNLEKATIKYIKSSLELSNFLWLNDNTPIELEDTIIPDVTTIQRIDNVLKTSQLDSEGFLVDNHPKIIALNNKYKSLEVDKRLKQNNLLPQLDLQYNFLSETPELARSFNTVNYKSGFNFSIPLFLRKERGDLKLSKLKLQNTALEIDATEVIIKNKIEAITQELESFTIQTEYTESIVRDYEVLLTAEERKLFLGESSLFLVNTRESRLIDSKLKAILLEVDFLNTKAKLFNVLANDLF